MKVNECTKLMVRLIIPGSFVPTTHQGQLKQISVHLDDELEERGKV